MNKQKKIFIIILMIFIVSLDFKISYAETTNSNYIDSNTIESQEETFGINSFLKNSEKYSGEFFNDIDIKEILNSAIAG